MTENTEKIDLAKLAARHRVAVSGACIECKYGRIVAWGNGGLLAFSGTSLPEAVSRSLQRLCNNTILVDGRDGRLTATFRPALLDRVLKVANLPGGCGP